ncbi:hypothetical protein [Caballeronia sp. GAWG1-1]|uniref:hypothetical protein n=1 Tax=Caballeronia sp. GAWG1-1 TaxID=2921742 RepID=UPI002028FBFC|nr:hypothetical protein [Caballeronia sp. GAWG1-1]
MSSQPSQQMVEFSFMTPSASEAEALLAVLRSIKQDDISFDDIDCASELSAVKGDKIVTAVLLFSLNVANGVIGNAIYDALKASPSAKCVANDISLTAKDVEDKAQLEAKLKAAARPSVQ